MVGAHCEASCCFIKPAGFTVLTLIKSQAPVVKTPIVRVTVKIIHAAQRPGGGPFFLLTEFDLPKCPTLNRSRIRDLYPWIELRSVERNNFELA